MLLQRLLSLRCLVLCTLLTLASAARAQRAAPIVTVDAGRIEGAALPTLPEGGAFLGIPYAAQPIGDLRWRPPQSAPAWSGVLSAKAYGPACPQAASGWLPEMLGKTRMATNEACLYLNVWTPHLASDAKSPVLVWIHGGGNVEGSAEWPPLGETLARRGIVVVSINYRLGIFGFYATPQLSAESPEHRSGNYGQLDQLAALDWVQKNIARFGGDPHQVTVAGQSSGALDICNLIASPLATDLFQRAILESGACVDSIFPTEREIEAANADFAHQLGPHNQPASLAQLRTLPAQQLLDAAAHNDTLDLEPAVDDHFLREQPAATFALGGQLPVSILTGSTANEVSIFVSPIVGGNSSQRPQTVASYHQFLNRKFGPLAPQIFAAYPAMTDAEVPRVFNTMFSDFDFGFSARLLAAETARIHQPIYLYHFAYSGQGPFAALGAFHAEELMFLSQRYWTSWVKSTDDARVSDALIGYWIHFIQTGNPNTADLPAWPTYNPHHLVQILGPTVTTAPDPRAARFSPFQQYLDGRLERLPNHGAAALNPTHAPSP